MSKNKKESAFFSVNNSIVDWIIRQVKKLKKLRSLRNVIKFLYFLATAVFVGFGLARVGVFIESGLRNSANLYLSIADLLLCPLILRIIYELLIKWLNRREARRKQMPLSSDMRRKVICPMCTNHLPKESAFCNKCGCRIK